MSAGSPNADDLAPAAAHALAGARRCLREGRLRRVARHCRTVLEAAPGHGEALFLWGIAALRAGDGAEAAALLEQAAAAAPRDAAVLSALAQALAVAGRHQDAARALARALELDPGSPDLRARHALSLQESGDLEGAVEQYAAALRARPGDPFLHYSQGTALKRLHRFDRAIDAYRAAVSLAPGETPMRNALAVALLERSRFAEAADAFEGVVAQAPSSAEAWYHLCFARMRCGRAEAALAAAERLLEVCEDEAAGRLMHGHAALSAGRFRVALDSCERVLAERPADRLALSDRAIALAALGRGDEARAVVALDRFLVCDRIALPPGHADLAGFNAALIEHIRGDPRLRLDYNSLSCHNGSTSGELLVEPRGPVAALEAAIHAAGDAYRARLRRDGHPWADAVPDRWQLSAWCTLLRSQGYQHGHIHPTAWLSGVYYARLPAGCGGDGHAGGIEFGRGPDHYPPGDQGEVRVVQPEEGMIVLFPSFLYHRTLPFVADEERVTVAFDFRPPGTYLN